MTGTSTYDKLYEIAEGQAGYFTSRQAGEAGVDRSVLSRQVRAGRLRRVRHGIYRLVHFPAAPDEDLVVAWLEEKDCQRDDDEDAERVDQGLFSLSVGAEAAERPSEGRRALHVNPTCQASG